MNNIIGVMEFIRDTAKISDKIPGVRTRSYDRIVNRLNDYHSSSIKSHYQELTLLRALHNAAFTYILYKKTSRSPAIEQLIINVKARIKVLTENFPFATWPDFPPGTINPTEYVNKSNYNYQVIIQLQNDDIVHSAVKQLASKNSEKTLIIQLDARGGHHQLVYGDPEKLTGNSVRWVLVGHGTTDDGLLNQHMSYLTPSELYTSIKRLRETMAMTFPQRIVLLGCKLGNNVAQQGLRDNFAQRFSREIYADKQNIISSVRAYSVPVMVNDRGQRFTLTRPTGREAIAWLQESRHRVDLTWDHGLLRTNNIPAILLIVNDIFLKKLSVDQAVRKYSDVLAYCFKGNDGAIDQVLLNQLIKDDAQQRDKFFTYLAKANQDPGRWQGTENLRHALTSPLIPIKRPISAVPDLPYLPIKHWQRSISPRQDTPHHPEYTLEDGYQVVIQLEEDQQLHQVVEGLVTRQPGNTLVIRYNITTGVTQVAYGDPKKLSGDNIRWFLVGYYRNNPVQIHSTFAGSTVQALARGLNTLLPVYALKIPTQVVLAAHNSDSIGPALINAMHDYGFYASVTAYRNTDRTEMAAHAVIIDDDPEGNTLWQTKSSHHKVDYTKEINKPIMVNGVPAAFLIVDDIYNGRLSIDGAIREYSDILKHYFATVDGGLDRELLNKTTSSGKRYQEFIKYTATTMENSQNQKSFRTWLEASIAPASTMLGESHGPDDGQYTQQNPLNKRIGNILAIMDNLATGAIKFAELNSHERRYLRDFFQREDGTLAVDRLILTFSDRQKYQIFYKKLHELLQMEDNHLTLQYFPGQEALQHSKKLNNSLSENIVCLQRAINRNITGDVVSQNYMAVNPFYINDGSHQAKRSTSSMVFAWLYTLSVSDRSGNLLLDALNICNEINGLAGGIKRTEIQDQHYRQLLDLLNQLNKADYTDKRYFSDMGNDYFFGQLLDDLSVNTQSCYLQLVADNHVFGIAKRTINGQQSWCLYNTDLGEIQLTGRSSQQIITVLKSTLYDYLNSKSPDWNNQTLAEHYGVRNPGGLAEFSFNIYKMDTVAVAQIQTLVDLQELITRGFGTGQQQEKNNGNITIDNVTLPLQTLYEMGATIDGYQVSGSLNFADINLIARLRFDPRILVRYFAVTSEQNALPAIKLLKKRIAEVDPVDECLLVPDKDPYLTKMASELLSNIEQYADNQQINSQPQPLLNAIPLHSNYQQTMNRVFYHAGQVSQAYGYYQILAVITEYWQKINNSQTTTEERQELTLTMSLALGQLSLDISEYGFHKLGNYLTGKTLNPTVSGLAATGLRLGRLRSVVGSKLIKLAGPLLGFASCGFDLYDAWRSFSRIDSLSPPGVRQDLVVSGSLSMLSAAVGIGTSLSMIIGGTAAKYGGPVGITMGISIILAGRIYAATNQIAAIKNHIRLSTSEEFRNGWRLFLGQYLESDTHNRLTEARSKEALRDNYNSLLKEQAEQSLAGLLSGKGISTYYYSTGTFDLEEHSYIRITGKEAMHQPSNTLGDPTQYYSDTKTIEDRISPHEAAATKLKYQRAIYAQKPRYTELSTEVSEYRFYTATPLRSVEDVVQADAALLSGGAAKVISLPTDEGNRQEKETAALFALGDGNDIATGHGQKKNIFIVQADRKQFTGGQLADSFLLMGLPVSSEESILDGGSLPGLPPGKEEESSSMGATLNDHDIVIAADQPVLGGGYNIDIKWGEVRYLSDIEKLVANLRNIEHAQGHPKTNDILTGNGLNNYLNGAGGRDELYGEEGDDILTLANGSAEGGKGIDTYCILQNSQEQDANIILKETASNIEINNIRMNYSAEQITDIDLSSSGEVIITLKNDNFTSTTLRLVNAYQFSSASQQFKQINQYILYTKDGMVLFPQWPQLIDTSKKWSFTPTLTGQYNPLLDQGWQEKFGDKKPEDVRIRLQRKDSNGSGRITVGDTQIRLPSFVNLATEGTPLNDEIEGDRGNDWLRSYQGSDILIGKGGADVYEVHEDVDNNREIIIDNDDNESAATKGNQLQQPDIDFLLIKKNINEITLAADKADIALRVPDGHKRSNYPKIRIRNFISDERYRHLMLVDKNGNGYSLELNELKQPYLKESYIQAQPSDDDDYIVISAFSTHKVYALTGDDVIVDNTGIEHILYGGPGNDVIVVNNGNSQLYGDEGDDQLYGGTRDDIITGGSGNDIISGGKGNDTLQDFLGDDTYLFSSGDGNDRIRDIRGADRLRFSGDEIDKNNLWFKRQGDHLMVLVSAQDSGDSVRLDDYFTKNINSNIIEVAGHRLGGADITALAQVMSNFPVFEFKDPLTGSPNLIQYNIDKHWSAVTE